MIFILPFLRNYFSNLVYLLSKKLYDNSCKRLQLVLVICLAFRGEHQWKNMHQNHLSPSSHLQWATWGMQLLRLTEQLVHRLCYGGLVQ